jgi:hypothetical protein
MTAPKNPVQTCLILLLNNKNKLFVTGQAR